MSLNVKVRAESKVTIIDMEGRITLGPATETLREAVRREAENSRCIILNLAKVSYMDSAGLGEMVAAHTHVTNRNGAIKLLNVQKRLQDLLQLTRLYTIFEAYEDENRAIRSFDSAASA
jgi:anti-sigma B factor antagonist